MYIIYFWKQMFFNSTQFNIKNSEKSVCQPQKEFMTGNKNKYDTFKLHYT